MTTSGSGDPPRLQVSFDADVWAEEVELLGQGTPMRAVAERARKEIGAPGVARSELRSCRSSDDGTRLALCLKAYVPLGHEPEPERPYAFIFELAEGRDTGVTLRLLAFGKRHPEPGTRSVYERAHRRRFGRYQDVMSPAG